MSTTLQPNRAAALIEALKNRLYAISDEELAAELGVGKSTISTWRRRGAIPARVEREIAAKYGITVEKAAKQAKSEAETSENLLRTAFFVVVIKLARERPDITDEQLAQELLHFEDALEVAIREIAADAKYKGVVGRARFLLDLITGTVDHTEIVNRAVSSAEKPASS